MKKTALLALLVLSPITASADIHKCIVNGHTTYQDTPCTQGAVPLSNTGTLSTLPSREPATRLSAPRVSRPAEQSQRSNGNRSDRYQSFSERRNAEVSTRTRPSRGMPQNRVYETYGRPNSRSTVMRNGKTCERLVWNNLGTDSARNIAVICDQKIYSIYGPHR